MGDFFSALKYSRKGLPPLGEIGEGLSEEKGAPPHTRQKAMGE